MDALTTLRVYLRAVYVPSRLDLKPSSAEQLEVAVSLLTRWRGREVLLSELSPEMVTEFLRSLGDSGKSPRTVNGRRASLITIWRHAARKGFAPRFDLADIPRRKIPRRHPTAWTADEMASIIAHLKRPWLKTMTLFIYETGARLSSTVQLTWDNWHPASRLMQLPIETSKTGLEQFVRVSPRTAERIESLRNYGQPRIFPCPADRRSIWRELKLACKAAGLPHTRRDLFQKIRRTNATLTAAATSAEVAAKQLGHSSPRMTIAAYIDPRMMPTVQAADVLPSLG